VRLLNEEWRQLPVTYAYWERQWLDRVYAVNLDTLPFEVAEGMIAYAAKRADLYRRMAERAEFTRTEPKLARGKSRNVAAPSWDPLLGMEGAGNDAGAGLGGSDGDDDDDQEDDEQEDDERGDVEEDEELLMGGEVDQE
jgi:hypothetical protein